MAGWPKVDSERIQVRAWYRILPLTSRTGSPAPLRWASAPALKARIISRVSFFAWAARLVAQAVAARLVPRQALNGAACISAVVIWVLSNLRKSGSSSRPPDRSVGATAGETVVSGGQSFTLPRVTPLREVVKMRRCR